MKTVTILSTNASGIKKAMTLSGIKVLRCRQSKQGILITIANIEGNKEKANKFFNEFDLTRKNGNNAGVINSSDKYLDYGTLYRTSINEL